MENEAAMWRKELIEAEKTIATLRQQLADAQQALAMVQPVVQLQTRLSGLEAERDAYRWAFCEMADGCSSWSHVQERTGLKQRFCESIIKLFRASIKDGWPDAPAAVWSGSNAESAPT